MDGDGLDVARLGRMVVAMGHNGLLGLRYVDHGPHWAEIALDWRADLVGDGGGDILASGPIVSLMDMASGLAVWNRRGRFANTATLDLRVDYLRAARPRAAVIGRAECYRMARRVAFVRGMAHDGDPADPVAHVAGTFMLMDAA